MEALAAVLEDRVAEEDGGEEGTEVAAEQAANGPPPLVNESTDPTSNQPPDTRNPRAS